MEVELYEGEVEFTLPVRVAPGADPVARKLVVSASYQSCNNKLCLPPKTVKVEVPITIGK
jgi:thiol:disulfide interchange protein DsbD